MFFRSLSQNVKVKELLKSVYIDQVIVKQESRTVAKKPRDAAALRFGLKFADIHCKFKSSQAPKARPQNSRHTGAK